MKPARLTRRVAAATTVRMKSLDQQANRAKRRAWCPAAVLLAATLAIAGCVSVKAPDKPIVIELNINIKQEVIYRLAADAGNTIDNNRDIF
jgi:YnbE-like lipoprotein